MSQVKIKTTYNIKELYVGKELVVFDDNKEATIDESALKGVNCKYFQVIGKVTAAEQKRKESETKKKQKTPRTKAELQAEAEELGLKFVSRTTVAELEAMIETHSQDEEVE